MNLPYAWTKKKGGGAEEISKLATRKLRSFVEEEKGEK